MTLPHLFYRRVKRLEELSASRDPYDSLEMAFILRSLLISDQNGLASQLLREHPELKPKSKKSRITFVVNDVLPFGDYGWVLDGIDPDIGLPVSKPKLKTRDGFLAVPVVKVGQRFITIHEVIDYLANKEGGVHRDRNGADKVLVGLQDEFGLAGTEGISSTMMGISRVVVKGLLPIMEKIEESEKNVKT